MSDIHADDTRPSTDCGKRRKTRETSPNSGSSHSKKAKNPNFCQKLLTGWWTTPSGRPALWRTQQSRKGSKTAHVIGLARMKGNHNPMKYGLAVKTNGQETDFAKKHTQQMPKQEDWNWKGDKNKVVVVWFD
jgi:hypothetical protein